MTGVHGEAKSYFRFMKSPLLVTKISIADIAAYSLFSASSKTMECSSIEDVIADFFFMSW